MARGADDGADGLLVVVRNPALARILASWAAANLAEWGTTLALSIYALAEGGPAAVGAMAIARTLPGAPMAPLWAVLADRRSRRLVLLLANAARAILVLATAAAAAAGAALWSVIALVAVLAAVTPALRPAFLALLPRLARTPQELAAATVAASIVRNGGFLVGSLGTGLLLTLVPVPVALALLAAIAGAAAVLALGLAPDAPPDADPDARPLRELAAGAGLVARHPGLLAIFLLTTGLFVVDGALDVLIVVAAVEALGAGEGGAGLLTSLWGLGCTVGGLVVGALLRPGRMVAGAAAGAGVVGSSLLVAGAVPELLVVAAGLFVFGIGYTFVETAAATLLARLVPDHLLGRVGGVLEATTAAGLAAGALAGGLLAGAVGPDAGFMAMALLVPAVALLAMPRLRRVAASATPPVREYELLRSHPIFAPLPVAETERLALALQEVPFADGDVVIRAGDPGDRFFLIAEGHVTVVPSERPARRLGPGEGLGEIALLRNVPRSATVTGDGDGLLLALERDTFLAAVASVPPAGRAAHRIAEARAPAAA